MSRYDFQSTFGGYDEYSEISLKNRGDKELLTEYATLREEARSRIKKLKNSKYKDSKILKNKEYLEVDPGEMDHETLARMTAYTAAFLASSQSTVEGQSIREERALRKLHTMGYINITEDNFKEFGDYMDHLQTYMNNQILTSEKLLDLFDEVADDMDNPDNLSDLVDKATTNNITLYNLKRNINFYEKNMKNIERLDLNPTRKRHYTATELRKKLSARDMLNE